MLEDGHVSATAAQGGVIHERGAVEDYGTHAHETGPADIEIGRSKLPLGRLPVGETGGEQGEWASARSKKGWDARSPSKGMFGMSADVMVGTGNAKQDALMMLH